MNAVLYKPGLGYYSAGQSKFGAEGDFITAPEISDLFGRSLARQCDGLFAQGCAPHLLEFGAGSGRLCEQLMLGLPELVSYSILELSADLRARQQQLLARSLGATQFARIQWLDRLPDEFDGIVLGNEVLDAMPVKVVRKEGDWRELGIGFDGERFNWCQYAERSEATRAMSEIETRVGTLDEGYSTEINLNLSPWLKALYASCNRVVVLMIDYGYDQQQYYNPARMQGTLNCFYRHRAHPDPLVYPGLQDVTAFVDFDAFADAAIDAGFSLSGYTTQGAFLLANGLIELAQSTAAESTQAQIELAQAIKTLTLPDEMGEKFKVAGLQKNLDLRIPALQGLSSRG